MRALVTGGTGFIGSNLVSELINQGHEVVITGTESEQQNHHAFRGKMLHHGLIGIDWEAIGKIDVLFHQAAINDTQCTDRKEIFRANVESSRKLFDYAITHGCKHIVFASSTATYGNERAPYVEGITRQSPINPYAESKVEMEKIALDLARKHPHVVFVGLRYCNVFGPGENQKGKRATMIYQLARQMITGNPRIFKNGEQKRDYIYVRDVVKANILASIAKESCIVNCGSGKAISFNDIIKELNILLGLDRRPIYIDNPYGSNYQIHTECDMSLAKEKLGFLPEYTFEQGLKDYFESGFLVSDY